MTPQGGRPRCAIYARLSKEDGDRRQSESESIHNQKALLAGYALDHGWEIYQVYCDEDYSGADSLRPDFNRMIAAAEQGRFQILLCKSQSRFTRDMELVEKYIHGLFPLWGIRFIAVADNADTAIRGNKKARQINGLVNQWYLEDLSDNIRMVLDLKRREGQYIGGSPLYGYRKDPADKSRLVPDPPAAAVVRQIFLWSLEGRGRQRIAGLLNGQGIPGPARYKADRGWGPPPAGDGLWSRTAVWRILRNEMYTGVMIQGRRKKASYKSDVILELPEAQWFKVEGALEPIVSRALFLEVQRGLGLRARASGGGEAHLLAGLVKCAACGSTMSKSSNGRQSYLRCAGYAAGAPCTRHAIRLDALVELISARIRHYVQAYYQPDPRDPPPQADPRRAALEGEWKALLAQLEKRRQALKALYLDRAAGIVGQDQFAELNRAFLEEKSRLEGRLGQVSAALAGLEGPRGQADRIERAQALLKLDPVPRELAAALVERIEIGERDPATGEQQVTVLWRF